ncbi:PAS domain-containing protein, partial [Halodesulfurarchaeum sp.]|uniref:PAS domain-containing protein n=1 Tax=Halodesulfurarchaeum sp. TaxID=1980530 RepID=UPI002FC3AD2D
MNDWEESGPDRPPGPVEVLQSFAPHPYLSLNADGEIITVNDAWLDLFGYDREAVIGRLFGEILTDRSRTKFESRFEDFKSSGGISDVEFEIKGSNDGTAIVSFDGVIEYDDQGNYVRTHCQFTDITDRKYRETFFVKSTDVIMILDDQGRAIYVTPSVERIMGYDPEELRGRRGFEDIHPEDRERAMEVFTEAIENPGTVVTAEYRILDADGSWRWVESRGKSLLDEPGPGGVIINARVIDERKEYEQQLMEQRDRLEYLESLENQLTEFSRDLIAANPESLEEKIADGLASLGELADADRSYVFQIDYGDETLSNTHEWTADGIEPQIDDVQDLPLDAVPWLVGNLENDESVTIPVVSELPPEASALREILEGQDIRSLIVSPMFSEGTLIGFIGFDWVEKQEGWSEEFVDLLRISGEMIAAKLQQESQRHELERVKERLELAVEGADIGVWDWDMETDEVTRHVNLREMLGYSPAEFGSRLPGWEQLVHPEGISKHDEVLREHIENRTEFYEWEYRLRAKSGDWKW